MQDAGYRILLVLPVALGKFIEIAYYKHLDSFSIRGDLECIDSGECVEGLRATAQQLSRTLSRNEITCLNPISGEVSQITKKDTELLNRAVTELFMKLSEITKSFSFAA